jgi:hypothetical protein
MVGKTRSRRNVKKINTTRKVTNPHHYIITRFSIVDSKHKGQFQSTDTMKNTRVKEYVLNPRRLTTKFNAFEQMTLPSVNAQTYPHYTWLIYTSDQLPNSYKQRLEKYKTDKIKIIYVSNFDEMNSDLSERLRGKKNYTTMRLDDDDGLCKTFLNVINTFASKSKNRGKIISISRGRIYTIRNKKIIYGSEVNIRRIALGLTAIGFNIMNAGNHTKVHHKYKVIYPTMENAYSLFASKQTASKRKFF